jgi:molybdopterin-guanine dinucleotide biosynthesis protein A
MMKPTISAYILCGGKSSRMGEEKGMVEFRGKPFVQWILDAVSPVVSERVIVTKNPAYGVFQLELIPDIIEDRGPVGGIYTALAHSSSDLVLILSCDVPMINAEVVSSLIDMASESPEHITFLSDGKNDYPLIGVYPVRFRYSFQRATERGELKLRQLLESLPHQRIKINPPENSSLQNINTKLDLLAISQTS